MSGDGVLADAARSRCFVNDQGQAGAMTRRCADMSEPASVTPDSPAALINWELSWLSFARRVLALAEDS